MSGLVPAPCRVDFVMTPPRDALAPARGLFVGHLMHPTHPDRADPGGRPTPKLSGSPERTYETEQPGWSATNRHRRSGPASAAAGHPREVRPTKRSRHDPGLKPPMTTDLTTGNMRWRVQCYSLWSWAWLVTDCRPYAYQSLVRSSWDAVASSCVRRRAPRSVSDRSIGCSVGCSHLQGFRWTPVENLRCSQNVRPQTHEVSRRALDLLNAGTCGLVAGADERRHRPNRHPGRGHACRNSPSDRDPGEDRDWFWTQHEVGFGKELPRRGSIRSRVVRARGGAAAASACSWLCGSAEPPGGCNMDCPHELAYYAGRSARDEECSS
jgi:hypothetical protein